MVSDDPKWLKIEEDKKSLFAFFIDSTLFAYIALAIWFIIDRWAAGQKAFQPLQLGMIIFGTVTIFWVMLEKKLTKVKYIFENLRTKKMHAIVGCLNALAMIVIVVLAVVDRIDWSFLKETIITATWEQLVFSVTLPYILVRMIGIVFKLQTFNIPASLIATVISGVIFGVVHTYAYGGDVGIIGYIILMGIGLHSFGYYFPSISITIHIIINIAAVGVLS